MRKWFLTFTACVMCFPFGIASADNNSSLIRLADRDDVFGWEAVGRLTISNRATCTGVLIASDQVLTAAHCVFDKETGTAAKPEEILFQAGLRDGSSVAQSKGLRVAAHKSYNPAPGHFAANIRYDVALIELASPISTFTAPPFKLHSGGPQIKVISIVSYGQDRNEALSWQKRCGILGRRDGLLAFDCDVTFGSSGAPVFAKENKRARIVSLISGGRQEDGHTISYGMELPQVVQQLKADLRSQPLANRPVAQSSFNRLKVGSKNTTGAKFIKN